MQFELFKHTLDTIGGSLEVIRALERGGHCRTFLQFLPRHNLVSNGACKERSYLKFFDITAFFS
mgnify:CR=1 FL=1